MHNKFRVKTVPVQPVPSVLSPTREGSPHTRPLSAAHSPHPADPLSPRLASGEELAASLILGTC